MRYMIISDIHGSESCLKKIMTIYEKEKFDGLIILGDILYHGPRNPLPEGHNPKAVAQILNAKASEMIACRGNCDAEVDQMVLNFPCLGDYSLIIDNGRRIFATHGHQYTYHTFPKVDGPQIFLYGHTHLWELRKENELLICNPGSISLPKENRPATYAVYDDGCLYIFTLDGKQLAQESLI